MSVLVTVRTSIVSYAEMSAFVTQFREATRDYFYSAGISMQNKASLMGVSDEINRQADMIGFINAFGMYMVASLCVLPLVALVRVQRPPA